MALLKIYGDSPTADGTDGTAISESGTLTNPITATLTVTEEDAATAVVKCALRCDSGYQTSGSFDLTLVDAETKSEYTGEDLTISKAADLDGTWSSSLTFDDSIGATNTLFYVKFHADAGTLPTTNTSVQLMHNAVVVEAS